MTIVDYKLSDIKPYEKNPRNNDEAVKFVANSIKEFGFKVPIVIDKDNVIVCGHTRYKAAKQLGLETVPCIMADDLTPAQIKAFRLADNKTAEKAEWDFTFLEEELADLMDFKMCDFGFEQIGEFEGFQEFTNTEGEKGTGEYSTISLTFPREEADEVNQWIKKHSKAEINAIVLEGVRK